MRKIAIVSYFADDLKPYYEQLTTYDVIIAADSGINSLAKINMRADICIGDFDSALNENLQFANQLEKLPTEKDQTDTKAAIEYANTKYSDAEIHVFTTMSGRMDQQFALLAIYYDCVKRNYRMKFFTEQGEILMLKAGTYCIPNKQERYFSCFAFGEDVTALTITGAYYPLENYTLKVGSDLGCSNEFSEKNIHISFNDGTLLVYLIKKGV